MPLLDTTRFDHLGESEVLQRIGALLATAIARSGRLQTRPAPNPQCASAQPALPVDPWELVNDPLEQQLMRYLTLTGPASPRELGSALGLNRRTVARKLARLRATGVCEVAGKTRAARYRLRAEFGSN